MQNKLKGSTIVWVAVTAELDPAWGGVEARLKVEVFPTESLARKKYRDVLGAMRVKDAFNLFGYRLSSGLTSPVHPARKPEYREFTDQLRNYVHTQLDKPQKIK